jgi:hypothetical protein
MGSKRELKKKSIKHSCPMGNRKPGHMEKVDANHNIKPYIGRTSKGIKNQARLLLIGLDLSMHVNKAQSF